MADYLDDVSKLLATTGTDFSADLADVKVINQRTRRSRKTALRRSIHVVLPAVPVRRDDVRIYMDLVT